MNWYCEDCGVVFNENDFVVESCDPWDGGTEYLCPHCGSRKTEECMRCDNCGDYVHPDDLIYFPNTNGPSICRNCFEYFEYYRDAFLALPVPDDPGWTWQGVFDEDRAQHRKMDFFEFIGYEDEASEAFYTFVQEREAEDGAGVH